MAEAVGLSPIIRDGHESAASFLNPVLSGMVGDDSLWNPQQGAWLPRD